MRALALALAVTLAAAAPASAEPHSRPVPDPWSAVDGLLAARPPAPSHTLARALTAGGVGAFYAGFATWAYFAWYADKAYHPFRAGGDGLFGKDTYAGGADKLGHFWANMTLTRLAYRVLRAGHWDPAPARAIAAGWAAAFFFLVEVKDGYFYQFSYGDEAGNLLGAALGVAFETWPRLDELFDVRVEYWPSKEYRAILDGAQGADVNSLNAVEDYSGETYLFATHLGAIGGLGDGRWTRWSRYVDAVVGYRTEHYKPDLHDPTIERDRPIQELSLGLSLNLQGVIDDALAGHGARRHARAALHAVTEVMNPPFGSARGNVWTRSTDPDSIIPE